MENVKELVRENLIKLRKANKFTQLELAQQIGYSDKAVSRWETGEVTPDIETLNSLSELYGVPLTAFFEKLDKNSAKKKRFKNLQIGNKMAISLLSVVCVWAIATVIFATLLTAGTPNAWLSFVWALPVSFIIAIVFNALWGRRGWTFVFVSLLIWTLILSVYLQLLAYNMFLLFIVGVPLQVCVILSSCIHSKKN
ncbi:MAG: helix-turn-helix transcriptional regulator [Clostridia bacterium]|nr:helix-turn-helix transcriptional regulator [Clostridia bacterium]